MTKRKMYELMLQNEADEYGADAKDPRVQELVELRVEDLNRKGCVPETFKMYCHSCDSCVDGRCPLEDWEDRHPEFKDDELAKRVKALETELYGWHKPPTHKTEAVHAATVAELIEKLRQLPADAVPSGVIVTVKL